MILGQPPQLSLVSSSLLQSLGGSGRVRRRSVPQRELHSISLESCLLDEVLLPPTWGKGQESTTQLLLCTGQG